MLAARRIPFVNRPVKRWMLRTIQIGFFALTLFYFAMMIPDNAAWIQANLGINLDKFTMGRTYRFQLIYDSNFVSTGLGSTYAWMEPRYGIFMEMDLLRLMFEVTFVGVAVMIWGYLDTARRSWYCMLVMLYQFLNLLTSHSLMSVAAWTMNFLTIGCIQAGLWGKGGAVDADR